MKKYFLFALALAVLAVAPVMADVSLSGDFNMSGAWNTSDEVYVRELDTLRTNVKATDDFNTFTIQIESNGTLGFYDDPKLVTDWGKFFGTSDMGFGIKTTTGLYKAATKDTVTFTGYSLEDFDSDPAIGDNEANIVVDLNIMDMVKPYFGMNFDTYGDPAGNGGFGYLMGAVVDFAPVTAEVYYVNAGKITGVSASTIGTEVMFSSEVSDGVVANAGATFRMDYNAAEEWDMGYGLGAGVEAFGAVANVALNGMIYSDAMDDGNSYVLSHLGVDANYAILDWLGVNAAFLMAIGDIADVAYGGESFLGAEFGVQVSPAGATYSLGYAINSEDSGGAYTPVVPYAVPANGGIYVAVDFSY